MLQAEINEFWGNEWTGSDLIDEALLVDGEPREEDILETALMYMELGHLEKADELLTVTLISDPSDYRLWMAAGIVRLRRGYQARARSAFQMASWLSGDPEAVALFQLCSEVVI